MSATKIDRDTLDAAWIPTLPKTTIDNIGAWDVSEIPQWDKTKIAVASTWLNEIQWPPSLHVVFHTCMLALPILLVDIYLVSCTALH